MVFYHGRIRDAYLISCDLPRGGLSSCPMICRMEVYPYVRPVLLLVIVKWKFLGVDTFGCIRWIYLQYQVLLLHLWWLALVVTSCVLFMMGIFVMIIHYCNGITIICIICIRWVVKIIHDGHWVSVYIVRVIIFITGFILIMWVVGGITRDDYFIILGIHKPIFVRKW